MIQKNGVAMIEMGMEKRLTNKAKTQLPFLEGFLFSSKSS